MNKTKTTCKCGADLKEDNSVYRKYNVTGHLSKGAFIEDDSVDGETGLYCCSCDEYIKGT